MTGSGKTTLARRLGELTGIPWHEADQLTWEPGWVQVSDEEQRSRIQAICDQDAWILDTAYGKWIDVPLARAELIVALDYPRWVSLGWLIKRTLARATDREPVCNGNQESWKLMFSRDSILLWHFKSFRRKRARILAWKSGGVEADVMHFTHPNQVAWWLASLDRATQPVGE